MTNYANEKITVKFSTERSCDRLLKRYISNLYLPRNFVFSNIVILFQGCYFSLNFVLVVYMFISLPLYVGLKICRLCPFSKVCERNHFRSSLCHCNDKFITCKLSISNSLSIILPLRSLFTWSACDTSLFSFFISTSKRLISWHLLSSCMDMCSYKENNYFNLFTCTWFPHFLTNNLSGLFPNFFFPIAVFYQCPVYKIPFY